MTPPPARRWPVPWRSAPLGRAVAAAALVAGVPVFLRMPPWCDLTLYDVAARNLLAGGVLYHDVFDTNLPGFVWALSAIRAVLGWNYEALRAVDLLIVAGAVALLDRLAARAGATQAARAWTVAGAAAFYPFTSEFNHCQRDVWMTVPALAAVVLRGRRLVGEPTTGWRTFRAAALEGALWGLAVWVKPHAAVPAAVVWLVTAPRLWVGGRVRALAADLLGMLTGGLTVGAAGVGALVATGAWDSFVEVFTFWNAGYAAVMWAELPFREWAQFHYFPPWSYLQVVTLPLAALMVLDARPWALRPAGPGPVGRVLPSWLWDAGVDDRVRFARLVLGALYLAWVGQAFFLQRDFHYVHVPETLMGLAVLASQRWAAGALGVVWLAVGSAVAGLGLAAPDNPPPVRTVGEEWGLVFTHPTADPGYPALWVECWRPAADNRAYYWRMNAAGRVKDFHGANDWEQLAEVAAALTKRGAGDGDVICWHDAPHALYLLLGVRPGFRFQHVSQMLGVGPEQERRLLEELAAAAPRAKWVVSDLMRVTADDPEACPDLSEPGRDNLLPPTLRWDVRNGFPYDHPAVFRSRGGTGRYVIHELRDPTK